MSKFADWLDKDEHTPWAFSQLYHIHFLTVKKAYLGLPIRIDSAKKIARITSPHVKLKDFLISRNPLTTTDNFSN